jgi:CheY-like chemotaxis protein
MATPTILLVDDEPDVREEIARVLKWWGYAVEEASDYQETMIRLSQLDCDLVLLDLKIPNKDHEVWGIQGGLETLRRIRDTQPTLPVVVFSLLVDEIDHIVFPIRMGAYDFLPKTDLLEQKGRCRSVIGDAVQGMSMPVSHSWSRERVKRRLVTVRSQIDKLEERIYGIELELAKGVLDVSYRQRLQNDKDELNQRLEELEQEEKKLRESI